MPSKHTVHFAVQDPDEFKANLATVFVRAALEGVDLFSHRKQSASKLVCLAVRYGAEASAAAAVKPPVMLTAGGPTDTERLKSAMARAGLTNATLGALLGVSRDVVKNAVRGLAMGPALRAWLQDQEAGR